MLNIPASRYFQTGEIIFTEGEMGDCSYFIEQGRIEIFIQREGKDHTLALLGKNEIFGEMAIIDEFPRSASARALSPTKLGIIHREQLKDRLTDADSVVRMMILVLLRRLRRETQERLHQAHSATEPLQPLTLDSDTQTLADLEGPAINKFKMEGLLRNAIHNNELELYYQPIVSLLGEKKEVMGFEALLRWNNSEGQVLLPSHFISVCEETNLIIPIGHWVIERALSDFQKIQKTTLNKYFIALNVSGRQIFDPDFFDHLEKHRRLQGLEAHSIKLEITEQIFVKGQSVVEWVNRAHELGYTLALDDFGTGYSSFSYLGRLPLDSIKVDRSFVQDIETDQKSLLITKAIIQLGKNFNIPTIAEGIETAEQLNRLVGLDCEYGQGFYFQRPVKLSVLLEFLSQPFHF